MGPVISIVLLYVLVSHFNDGMDKALRTKVIVLAVAVLLLQLLANTARNSMAPAAAVLMFSPFLIAAVLIGWGKVERTVAMKIGVSYLAAQIGLVIAVLLLVRMMT
jgi:hypothetical protein